MKSLEVRRERVFEIRRRRARPSWDQWGDLTTMAARDAADIPLMNSFGPHVLKGFNVWTYDLANVPASAVNQPSWG